ncbi:MAG: glycoside hydrolase family 3 protein [Lachnospiraceae bacterium]|nr:glycoside hydrolase family 3 protein [Lachnospiraceae bacterium]
MVSLAAIAAGLLVIAGLGFLVSLFLKGSLSGGQKTAAGTSAQEATLQNTQGDVSDGDETDPGADSGALPGTGDGDQFDAPSSSGDNGGIGEDLDAAGSQQIDPETEAKIDGLLSSLSVEQKAAQLFFITPEQLTGVEQVTAAGEMTKAAYEKNPVGGLIYFASNFEDPDQTKEMLKNMQTYATQATGGIPVFLGVDEEGGKVERIASNPAFGITSAGSAAEHQSEQDAKAAGEKIGEYLKEYGLNVDFAPVADVLSNPENSVIGPRSFGEDPEQVKTLAKAYSDGLHAAGIKSTYKHFPGHGATKDDTHEGTAYTDKSKEELAACDLIPFADAQTAGTDFVMVSHITLPTVLEDDTPCSLSEKMITGCLRNELGYQGIVITDSFTMGAITQHYSAGDAAVKAILAGADMILMPEDYETAYQAVLSACKNGQIPEARLNEALRHILRCKLT